MGRSQVVKVQVAAAHELGVRRGLQQMRGPLSLVTSRQKSIAESLLVPQRGAQAGYQAVRSRAAPTLG